MSDATPIAIIQQESANRQHMGSAPPLLHHQPPTANDLRQWLHQRVFIRKGRFVGHTGEVLDFINGKLRVRVGEDTVNKQVAQLEVFDPTLHMAPLEVPGLTSPLKPTRHPGKAGPSLIGSRVRILNGKFDGCNGFVSKGGNGYFAVEIEGNAAVIVMKRSSELVVLSSSIPLGEATTGEDVRKAAVILLDLMRSDSPPSSSKKRFRLCEPIEGYSDQQC